MHFLLKPDDDASLIAASNVAAGWFNHGDTALEVACEEGCDPLWALNAVFAEIRRRRNDWESRQGRSCANGGQVHSTLDVSDHNGEFRCEHCGICVGSDGCKEKLVHVEKHYVPEQGEKRA